MTLLLDNADVLTVLRMDDCIEGGEVGVTDRAARDAGIGRELPTEWFTQEEKP